MTKKRFITLLLAIIMIATLLTGCGKKSETITSEKNATIAGSYKLFQTKDVQEYFAFLETFDESKYEIVDISTSMASPGGHGSSEFYMVTYKTIAK